MGQIQVSMTCDTVISKEEKIQGRKEKVSNKNCGNLWMQRYKKLDNAKQKEHKGGCLKAQIIQKL